MTFLARAIFGSKVKSQTPTDRSYYGELASALGAQTQIAPQVFAAESQWRPKYAALDLSTLGQTLNGNPHQTNLLDLYRGAVPQEQQLRSDVLGADSDLLRAYGPGYGAAMRASTGAGDLVGNLVRGANVQYNMGSQVDPLTRAQLTNSVRAGQSARGLGYGQGDANAEALAINAGGEQLRQQRTANAQSAAQLSAGLSDNAESWLHQTPQAVGYANNAYQIASTNGANIFRPESQYFADLANQKYQGTLQTNQANAANQAALIGGGMKADSSILSSL